MMNSGPVKPKLSDIAKLADVSVSTVSQVLHGRGRIADATRKKILTAAEELNYRKNSSKVTSRAVNTSPGAALVHTGREWNFLWNFERLLLNRIEDKLAEMGFSLIFIPLRPDNSSKDILEKISTSGASAVFPMHYGNEELFNHLVRMGIPLVVVFNNRFSNQFPSIGVDDSDCMYTGVAHLLRLGHCSVCFADCPMEKLETTNRERLSGFTAGMSGRHAQVLSFHRLDRGDLRKKLELMFLVPSDRNRLRSTTAGKKPAPPTAIIAVDDDAALRVYLELTEMGFTIPDDMSIIAPGDVLDYSLPSTPPISTLQIDIDHAGAAAAEMMHGMMRKQIFGSTNTSGGDFFSVTVPYRLVDRGSCSSPPRIKGPGFSTSGNGSTTRRRRKQ